MHANVLIILQNWRVHGSWKGWKKFYILMRAQKRGVGVVVVERGEWMRKERGRKEKHICQLVCKCMRVTPSEIQSGCHLGRGCYYKVPMKCGLRVAMQNKARPQTGRHSGTGAGVCGREPITNAAHTPYKSTHCLWNEQNCQCNITWCALVATVVRWRL